MKQKILVTGGTGYIGSHTAVELINSGFEVVIVDDLSNSSIEVLDSIEKITGTKPAFYQFNLQDMSKTQSLFAENKDIKAIIHFAASKAVGESVQEPLLYYKNNVLSLINLVEAMRISDVKNIVFSSSCTVYGQPDELPVTEETPRKEAESPYGNTKAICEDILRDSAKAYGNINAIALRYFNPIGAHESGLIGELPQGIPNNLLPYITQTAAGLRDELKVFGDDYNTPDGSCIRDFINVVDLAKAHVFAINRLLDGKNNGAYEYFNVGTGNGASVLELVKTFSDVNKIDLKYSIVGRRAGDIEKIYADTTKANQELGWTAEKTLAETLASAWNWEKHYRGLK
ncbi:UDP-glucose 4-epimerase GalE [Saccharicrinis sp. FJH54]|uniref:UDP-glucose 4-epimerase GalE n=1 Tax=Saccharicrinis sp. FJH54 TaxID=3344665 RepID=UPI0035D424C5